MTSRRLALVSRLLKNSSTARTGPNPCVNGQNGPRNLILSALTELHTGKGCVSPQPRGGRERVAAWATQPGYSPVEVGSSGSRNRRCGFVPTTLQKGGLARSNSALVRMPLKSNAEVLAAQAAGQPVISVDTKKKELVGNYRNAGSDWRPKGDPQRVKVHDFEDKKLGNVAPYGVYDIAADAGWVSVGITHDTAEFAVASIRTWLDRVGRARYPNMRELTITADCGGSNGTRLRLWKVELQKLADETGLTIKVRHYPPGTSKWNKIEHRLFCRVTQNWRGRPLTDRAAVIELIAATTTKTGLKSRASSTPGSTQEASKQQRRDEMPRHPR